MPKRLKLIACEILYREFCAAVARSVNRVDIEFLPKGLHDLGSPGMNERIAARVADVDDSAYDAVVLGYALCSNGLVGLTARSIPLVVPRAHDCITLFLGSKERYLDYFRGHPGAYFKTSGWIERGDDLEQLSGESIQRRSRMAQSYDELVERYGEDNARFLYEELQQMTRNYSRIAYVEMGIEPDDRFERDARELAVARGWQFDQLAGDMRLIQELVDGPWNDNDFLTVPPGHRIAASFDERIIRAEPVPG
ncbi:MAG: DUF1638 domain-containing protein [Thermoguttaceae bacterium]|nr:DUF1638 domain-containing protein [Thermoguttaceae bacterium]